MKHNLISMRNCHLRVFSITICVFFNALAGSAEEWTKTKLTLKLMHINNTFNNISMSSEEFLTTNLTHINNTFDFLCRFYRDALAKSAPDIIHAFNEFGFQLLHLASATGRADICQVLLEAGADKDKPSKGLLETPLHLASANDHAAVAKLLIDAGVPLETRNVWGGTPLHCAASRGSMDVVEMLLARGSNIHATTTRAETALHLAKSADVIEFLIEQGLKVNALDDNQDTVLHRAVARADIRACMVVLANQAEVDVTNLDDETPLHIAARLGHDTLIQMLLNVGSNPDLVNVVGMTAADVAVKSGRARVYSRLKLFNNAHESRVRSGYFGNPLIALNNKSCGITSFEVNGGEDMMTAFPPPPQGTRKDPARAQSSRHPDVAPAHPAQTRFAQANRITDAKQSSHASGPRSLPSSKSANHLPVLDSNAAPLPPQKPRPSRSKLGTCSHAIAPKVWPTAAAAPPVVSSEADRAPRASPEPSPLEPAVPIPISTAGPGSAAKRAAKASTDLSHAVRTPGSQPTAKSGRDSRRPLSSDTPFEPGLVGGDARPKRAGFFSCFLPCADEG